MPLIQYIIERNSTNINKYHINQRFIVWKLNNTNVDWKNTATVLNCVSARWQDEEDKTDRRFRYFGLARASQVTAKATILYGT
jgi:hypothetical protein